VKERTAHILGWLAAGAISAYACWLARIVRTPVDGALPFIAIVLVSLAFAARMPALMLSVPLLIIAQLTLVPETMRLLAFGAIVAAAITVPLAAERRRPAGWPAGVPPALPGRADAAEPAAGTAALPATIAAILLLRWIPLDEVHLFRELFLLAVAIAIVYVLGRTPFAAAAATITALVTPAVPLRTLALPLLVLFAAAMARLFGMPRLRLTLPSVIAVAFAMLFFAWSGIVARAFPYFLKPYRAEAPRVTLNWALQPAASKTFDVPPNATALIVSGANVPRMRSGILGALNGAPIRIGDVADWGYMRRDHFYGSRNPLPRDPAGKIRGYGYNAWVDGAGRIELPRGAKTIQVTAAPNLPKDAFLQVEAFEIAAR
jgi:hypothetical protein